MPRVDTSVINRWFGSWDRWLGLPSGTLETIARIENSYDPVSGYYSGASSRAGARGLMQLMPIALRDIKNEFGVDVNPDVPAFSVMGAAMLLTLTRRYMRASLAESPFTLGDLLAGYNGGWTVGRNRARGLKINKESESYVEKARSLGLDVDKPV